MFLFFCIELAGPDEGEGIASEGGVVGNFHEWFHGMLALSVKESLVVHEMKCNGAAGTIAGVGGGAVPGEGMMIVDMAGGDGAVLHSDFVAAELTRHGLERFEGFQKIDVIAPVMGARNHLHAAVGFIGIVQSDPGGDLPAAGENRPVRRILVPHVDAAGAGGFVLDLIVEQAELIGVSELGDIFGDGLVTDQGGEGWAGLPDVDDLPDGIVLGAGEIAEENGFWA